MEKALKFPWQNSWPILALHPAAAWLLAMSIVTLESTKGKALSKENSWQPLQSGTSWRFKKGTRKKNTKNGGWIFITWWWWCQCVLLPELGESYDLHLFMPQAHISGTLQNLNLNHLTRINNKCWSFLPCFPCLPPGLFNSCATVLHGFMLPSLPSTHLRVITGQDVKV